MESGFFSLSNLLKQRCKQKKKCQKFFQPQTRCGCRLRRIIYIYILLLLCCIAVQIFAQNHSAKYKEWEVARDFCTIVFFLTSFPPKLHSESESNHSSCFTVVIMTSVAPLSGPVCGIRADPLQRVLFLPETVHTLVSDGREGALHQPTVCRHPRLYTCKTTRRRII